MSKTVLFQTIQLNFKKKIYFKKFSVVLFDPLIGPYHVVPLRARVDLGAMAIKGYSAFLKAPALLKPH